MSVPVLVSPREQHISWGQVGQHRGGGHLTPEAVMHKVLEGPWTLGLWVGFKGRARSGERVGTESEWVKLSSRFLPPSP